MSQRVALFPGSFDPFTNGHLDLTRRAAAVFDRVVVAIAVNPAKSGLFTPAERVDLIKRSLSGLRGVDVMHFGGLVVDCAEELQVARTVARSGITESQVRQIMATQWPRWRRLQMADDVIWNGGAPGELAPQCERIHREYARAEWNPA